MLYHILLKLSVIFHSLQFFSFFDNCLLRPKHIGNGIVNKRGTVFPCAQCSSITAASHFVRSMPRVLQKCRHAARGHILDVCSLGEVTVTGSYEISHSI